MSTILSLDQARKRKEAEDDVSNRPDVKVAARTLFNAMESRNRKDAADGTARYLTVDALRTIIKDHREHCRRHGVPFPRLVLVDFPIVGAVEVLRDDLDFKSVQVFVVNMTQKYPHITTHELATSIAAAFPRFRPGSVEQVNYELRRKPRMGERFAQ